MKETRLKDADMAADFITKLETIFGAIDGAIDGAFPAASSLASRSRLAVTPCKRVFSVGRPGARGAMAEPVARGLLSAALLLMAASCTWSGPPAPSVLVIAVEELGFGAVPCAADAEGGTQSGFETLCLEAVRFTHAYTTSTLSVPALASVVTGRYPHEHLVRDNGSAFLSARFETVAEAALEAGFRTAYFGGGPPVWRNSGLNQGFETFDDGVPPGAAMYRPVAELSRLFLDWRAAEPARRPTLAFLHVADAQFIDAPTMNDLGEVRTSNYRGQVEEIDESLGALFRALKERKLWDATTVIVFGLAGHVTEARMGEARETNVNSERSRVAFFIKPSRRSRESSFNWKIDANVSLADLGPTLYGLLGKPHEPSRPPSVSLRGIFDRPEPDWDQGRLVITESSWASWRGLAGRRFALRKGPFLYLHDGGGRLFNTLTDSLETAPLSPSDLRYRELWAPFDGFAAESGWVPWARLSPALVERLRLARELWRGVEPRAAFLPRLRGLARENPTDGQLQGWRAMVALKETRWAELKDAAARAGNPVWSYVAAVNLGEKAVVPEDPCMKLFARPGAVAVAPTLRECPSRELLELFAWADETQPHSRRQAAMERFLRLYAEAQLDDRIAAANQASGLTWDIPMAKPEGPRASDLVLALPGMRRLRGQVDRRSSGENK